MALTSITGAWGASISVTYSVGAVIAAVASGS